MIFFEHIYLSHIKKQTPILFVFLFFSRFFYLYPHTPQTLRLKLYALERIASTLGSGIFIGLI